MATTGKVTPSGKWHNTEAVEPECLQSQAVCTYFAKHSQKKLQAHTCGIKKTKKQTKKNEGFHSKTLYLSEKKTTYIRITDL